jgi:2-C-methyl-D-erythritol 4-phosphate cytidylyltransferase
MKKLQYLFHTFSYLNYFYGKVTNFREKVMQMKKFVLIVAGGRGSRMKQAVPKQFAEIAGKPILMHTFEAFLKYDERMEFFLVLPETEITDWKKLCEKNNFNLQLTLVAGGETRFQSVKNGLAKIVDEGIVFIHDGVRPFVSVQTIENCYKMALEKGNALPVIPVSESVREILNGGNRAVDRRNFFMVQTPQTFRVSAIKNAYNQNYSEKFTDDASVLESRGETINLVEGNRENLKITYPADLKIARAFSNT